MAIVGGGISGLYCAMNLMTDPRTVDRGIKNIVLLEGSDRFGGRFNLDSVNGASGIFRFAYKDLKSDEISHMPLMSQLVTDLGMQDDVIKETVSTEDSSVGYFGGCHVTNLDVKLNPTIWKDLFHLRDDEEIRSVDDADIVIYKRLLEHNKEKLKDKYPNRAAIILAHKDQTSLQDPDFWTFFKNVLTWPIGPQEVALRDLPMSTLVSVMKFSPSFSCLMDTKSGSRDAGTYLQNQMSMKMLNTEFHHLNNGWTSMINKIEKQLLDLDGTNGIHIKLRRNCCANRLMVMKDEAEPIYLGFEEDSKTAVMAADKVIMAVPPPNVEKISLRLGDTETYKAGCDVIKKMCSKVSGEDMTFINLFFKSDWWNKKGDPKIKGPSFSDLPCSIIYPFYSSCVKKGCSGCKTCSDDPSPVGLTIFSRRKNAEFWASLQRIGNPYNLCAIKNPELTPTSEAVVDVVMDQLKEIFRRGVPPQPVMATYRRLDKDSKYGYPSYCWKVGVVASELEGPKPIPDRNLYFCHDAWSDYQGWVEGSLRSTKNVVERVLEKSN